jgi:hypothetical protein
LVELVAAEVFLGAVAKALLAQQLAKTVSPKLAAADQVAVSEPRAEAPQAQVVVAVAPPMSSFRAQPSQGLDHPPQL